MRENGIKARHKRRYKAMTDSRHGLPVAANRVRDFTPAAPNRVWTADITYVWTAAGWLYLAGVLELFNREVVGWSIKPRMTAELVTDALTMAWFRRKPGAHTHGRHRGQQRRGRHATAQAITPRALDDHRPRGEQHAIGPCLRPGTICRWLNQCSPPRGQAALRRVAEVAPNLPHDPGFQFSSFRTFATTPETG